MSISPLPAPTGDVISLAPQGQFTKYSDNEGNEYEDITLGEGLRRFFCGDVGAGEADAAGVAAAFSYFTHIDSGGTLVVCDIQGVGLVWTDPQIHTADGRGYGMGNLGREGIESFLAGHRHGATSRRLGLPRMRPSPPERAFTAAPPPPGSGAPVGGVPPLPLPDTPSGGVQGGGDIKQR